MKDYGAVYARAKDQYGNMAEIHDIKIENDLASRIVYRLVIKDRGFTVWHVSVHETLADADQELSKQGEFELV